MRKLPKHYFGDIPAEEMREIADAQEAADAEKGYNQPVEAIDEHIERFIRRNKIRMIAVPVDQNPNMAADEWARTASHFRCVLRHGNRRMTVYYSLGSALKGEPELAEVLDCIALDSAGIADARSLEDWCAEYGYDPNSRNAARTYRVSQRNAVRLRSLLGNAEYCHLLWNTSGYSRVQPKRAGKYPALFSCSQQGPSAPVFTGLLRRN